MKRLLLLMLLLIPLTAEAGPQGRGEPCVKDSDCGTMLACRNLGCRSVEDIRFCSNKCSKLGFCTAKDGGCWATSDADCKASTYCAKNGWCTAKDGDCQAISDADCKGSTVCSERGRCTAKDGHCWK